VAPGRPRGKAHSEAFSQLERIVAQIDFDSERYYNLYFDSLPGETSADLGREAWASLQSFMADLSKVRGELYRLSRGVEQIQMPAIEAVGLDKVTESLRALEVRLRPLGEAMGKLQDDGGKRLVKDLLDVLDPLDRVFELMERQPGSVSEGVARGLRSVYDLLLSVLAKAGLSAMPISEEFNPHWHLAMGTDEAPGKRDGTVSRVLLKGYLYQNQVFRTAQVAVVKNGANQNGN
jgi:molecular chaperone GrpE